MMVAALEEGNAALPPPPPANHWRRGQEMTNYMPITETTIDLYGVQPIRVRAYVRSPEAVLSYWPKALDFGPEDALGRNIRIVEDGRPMYGTISHVEGLPDGCWRLRFEMRLESLVEGVR